MFAGPTGLVTVGCIAHSLKLPLTFPHISFSLTPLQGNDLCSLDPSIELRRQLEPQRSFNMQSPTINSVSQGPAPAQKKAPQHQPPYRTDHSPRAIAP